MWQHGFGSGLKLRGIEPRPLQCSVYEAQERRRGHAYLGDPRVCERFFPLAGGRVPRRTLSCAKLRDPGVGS